MCSIDSPPTLSGLRLFQIPGRYSLGLREKTAPEQVQEFSERCRPENSDWGTSWSFYKSRVPSELATGAGRRVPAVPGD